MIIVIVGQADLPESPAGAEYITDAHPVDAANRRVSVTRATELAQSPDAYGPSGLSILGTFAQRTSLTAYTLIGRTAPVGNPAGKVAAPIVSKGSTTPIRIGGSTDRNVATRQ